MMKHISDICGTGYQYKRSLNRHNKEKHADEHKPYGSKLKINKSDSNNESIDSISVDSDKNDMKNDIGEEKVISENEDHLSDITENESNTNSDDNKSNIESDTNTENDGNDDEENEGSETDHDNNEEEEYEYPLTKDDVDNFLDVDKFLGENKKK